MLDELTGLGGLQFYRLLAPNRTPDVRPDGGARPGAHFGAVPWVFQAPAKLTLITVARGGRSAASSRASTEAGLWSWPPLPPNPCTPSCRSWAPINH